MSKHIVQIGKPIMVQWLAHWSHKPETLVRIRVKGSYDFVFTFTLILARDELINKVNFLTHLIRLLVSLTSQKGNIFMFSKNIILQYVYCVRYEHV